jgi:putative spermidine/putrescine transport system permease protein
MTGAMPSDRKWRLLRGTVCVLLAIYMVVPLAIVVIISFSSAAFLQFPPPGLSLQWYQRVMNNPVWLNSLATSVKIMMPAALLATVLGTAAAVGLSRGRFPGAGLVAALLMAPMIVPVIITAAAMLGFAQAFGLYGTLEGLILAHTLVIIPYVMATTMAALDMVDRSLEDAALTLGATPWMTFRRVTFPLILPGVLSGLLFAMVISFDELIVSLFLSTPELRPVTVEMWSDIRGDVDPTISAIATGLFAFSLMILLAESAVRHRAGRGDALAARLEVAP